MKNKSLPKIKPRKSIWRLCKILKKRGKTNRQIANFLNIKNIQAPEYRGDGWSKNKVNNFVIRGNKVFSMRIRKQARFFDCSAYSYCLDDHAKKNLQFDCSNCKKYNQQDITRCVGGGNYVII